MNEAQYSEVVQNMRLPVRSCALAPASTEPALAVPACLKALACLVWSRVELHLNKT